MELDFTVKDVDGKLRSKLKDDCASISFWFI